MSRPKRFFSAVLMGSLLVSLPAVGQDQNAASTFYGRGVHAYFAGQDKGAEYHLSLAIQSNPNDPRPYYFRAVSRLRQGRVSEARQDMQVGAAIETGAPGHWAVGSALQRVQGTNRLMLEQYRRRARRDAAIQRENRMRARYDLPLIEPGRPADPQHLRDRDQGSPSLPLGDPFADDTVLDAEDK